MTTTVLKSKLHKYIDEADTSVLEVVFKLLEVYRKNNSSLLSDEQQKEVLKRSSLFKAGKIKGYTLTEARKLLK